MATRDHRGALGVVRVISQRLRREPDGGRLIAMMWTAVGIWIRTAAKQFD